MDADNLSDIRVTSANISGHNQRYQRFSKRKRGLVFSIIRFFR